MLGGRGSRLRPISDVCKHLLPVGGRPMAVYGLELLYRCGISTATAVVRPEDADEFRCVFDRAEGARVTDIVVQPDPAGTADGLERCADVVEQDYIATLWGDNLFEYAPVGAVRRFLEHPAVCQLQVSESSDPQHFSTVDIDERGRVRAVVDKPEHPTTATVCTGLILFHAATLFHAAGTVTTNDRGERDVMDCVRTFAATDEVVAEPVRGYWLDAAVSPETYYEARRFALNRGFNNPPFTDEEISSWTSTTPQARPASCSTPPGVVSWNAGTAILRPAPITAARPSTPA
nr:sugar phosphate nucleotidyltransferase [Nocardia mexicana]